MRRLLRFSLVACLLGLLSLVWIQPHAQASQQGRQGPVVSYSCGTQTFGHCYGAVNQYPTFNVPGGGFFYGVQTSIRLSSLHTSSGAITDEVWMMDGGDTRCPGSTCWVEAGLVYDASSGLGLHFFWADIRPNQHSCPQTGYWCLHPATRSPLSASDLSQSITMTIYNSGAGKWTIRGMVGGSVRFTGTSISNLMQVNKNVVGQELTGSGTSGSW